MIGNDIKNIIIVIIISLLLHDFFNTLLFIVTFGIMRIHCGGFHASTKTKCTIVFVIIYIFFELYKNLSMPIFVEMIISLICYIYIMTNAPVEHKKNILTDSENKHNRTKSALFSSILFITGLIFSSFNIIVYKPFYYSLIANSVLMIILVNSKNWRYYRGN